MGVLNPVLYRTIVAIIGGYVLANLLAITIGIFFSGPSGDGVMTGMILSFLIYAGAIMWVFSTKTLTKACIGLFIPSVVCLAFISFSIVW